MASDGGVRRAAAEVWNQVVTCDDLQGGKHVVNVVNQVLGQNVEPAITNLAYAPSVVNIADPDSTKAQTFSFGYANITSCQGHWTEHTNLPTGERPSESTYVPAVLDENGHPTLQSGHYEWTSPPRDIAQSWLQNVTCELPGGAAISKSVRNHIVSFSLSADTGLVGEEIMANWHAPGASSCSIAGETQGLGPQVAYPLRIFNTGTREISFHCLDSANGQLFEVSKSINVTNLSAPESLKVRY